MAGKKSKTPKTPKVRTTPAEERAFIIAELRKEVAGLEKSAKEVATKAGGFDYAQAVIYENHAEAYREVIYTIEFLEEA